MSESENEARARMERFFFRFGYAVTRWGHVDRALFDFSRFALGATEEKTAVVFYRSPNIREHLMLADALMDQSLNKRLLKRWEAIVEMAEEHLPFRNELAHNPPVQAIHITAVLGEPKFPVPSPKSWWEITTEKTKLLHRKRRPLTAKEEDITNHIHAVNKLLEEMWAFRKMLPKRPRRSSAPKAAQASGLKTKNDHARGPRKRRRRSSQP